jgi:UDP-3-O-[3-hydroxymyristoyl] glucosamine N-acyltransferase
MKQLSVSEIILKTGCEAISYNENTSYTKIAPLHLAGPEDISFLINEKYFDEALKTKAGALICSRKHAQTLCAEKMSCTFFVSENPHAVLAKISQIFFEPQHPFQGISLQAYLAPDADIHPTATIFPFVFVASGAKIGQNTVIYSGCFIGASSTIGDHCILYPNVVVREKCFVGKSCILNPGAVIGGDGFGFAATAQENIKIPQIGGVRIEDEVEIGANTTIDRGAFADTHIARQTKIDNLVMVAHNVVIGERCFLAGQVGIAGSVTVGTQVVMGGQVGIAGHLKIGDRALLTAQSGISKNVPVGETWGGTPARPYKEYALGSVAVHKLVQKLRKKST